MAVATGWTTTALLGTAGLSPNQYGLDVLLDLPNNSVFLGQGGPRLITSYEIGKGNTLYAPVISARTATARVRGTDDGNALTYGALGGTAVQFTKRTAYDAYAIDYMAFNDMPPANLTAELNGTKAQSSMALANDVDGRILLLYSSAANAVGAPATDFASSELARALKMLKVANAPGRTYAVVPATQWDKLANDDNLTRYDIRGEVSPIAAGLGVTQAFRYFDTLIFTTGNCPVVAGVAHGLVFSEAGIVSNFRDMPTLKDWDDPNTASYKLMLWMDWVYANSFSDWIVDFQFSNV